MSTYRDRSRQVRDGSREDVSTRRSSRPDGDRSRDDRDKGRGVVEPDRRHRGTDKDRGEQLDRGGRDQEHVGEQEWDYSRHRDSRDRSKDLKVTIANVHICYFMQFYGGLLCVLIRHREPVPVWSISIEAAFITVDCS